MKRQRPSKDTPGSCLECGCPSEAKLCSDECRARHLGDGATGQRREHRPRPMLPCERCGVVRPKSKRNHGRHYCGVECSALAQTTALARQCEQCGRQFKAVLSDVAKGGCRFCNPECSHAFARANPANEKSVLVFGERYTLRELSQASGLPKTTILTRIKRGMTPEQAVLSGAQKTGRKPGWRERQRPDASGL